MTIDILLHDKDTPVTIICGYSPTNTTPVRTRDNFYSQLKTITKPSYWLMGDFNARVGHCVSADDPEFAAEASNIVGQ